MNDIIFFLKKLKYQLFEEGVNKIHYALMGGIAVIILMLLMGGTADNASKTNQTLEFVTPLILAQIYQDNLNNAADYAESKPILTNMEQYLYRFESQYKTQPKKAEAALLIVKQRFDYLERKKLEVARAEKILDDFVLKVNHNPY